MGRSSNLSATTSTNTFIPQPSRDPDYYNDLPGKAPPEHQPPTSYKVHHHYHNLFIMMHN